MIVVIYYSNGRVHKTKNYHNWTLEEWHRVLTALNKKYEGIEMYEETSTKTERV